MKGNRAFGTHMLRKFKGIPEKFVISSLPYFSSLCSMVGEDSWEM